MPTTNRYDAPMRCLGLDVSDRRIGVAMTDPLGWTIQPMETIDRQRPEQDLDAVTNYIQDYGIKLVVVGIPLRGVEGTVGIQARKALQFCDQLRGYCQMRGLLVQVEPWDESLTTQEARAWLKQQQVKKKRRKEATDQLAAVFILQNYLMAQESKAPEGPA